jgi:hypothetical protein
MDLHAFEVTADLHHPTLDDATVGFELGLTGAACADAAAETLEMSPLSDQTRHQVGELRELHLKLAFSRTRSLREDVEDERGAVDDFEPRHLGDVPLLHRRERIVGDEEVGALRLRQRADLLDLAAPEIERRRRRRTVLDDPCGDLGACCHDERGQLVQRLVDLEPALSRQSHRADHRALAATSLDHVSVAVLQGRLPSFSRRSMWAAMASASVDVVTSSHSIPGSRANHVPCRFA